MTRPTRRRFLRVPAAAAALAVVPPFLLVGCGDAGTLTSHEDGEHDLFLGDRRFRSIVSVDNSTSRRHSARSVLERFYHLRFAHEPFESAEGEMVITLDMISRVRRANGERIHVVSGDLVFLVDGVMPNERTSHVDSIVVPAGGRLTVLRGDTVRTDA